MDPHETRTLIRFNTFMHARTHARMKFETANDFTWEDEWRNGKHGKTIGVLHGKRALDSFLGTEIGIEIGRETYWDWLWNNTRRYTHC